jgi:glutamine synthetase
MHGYSLLRPSLNQKYFYELFDLCGKFRLPLEGLHTETGPGVFEVALAYDGEAQFVLAMYLTAQAAAEIADRAALFKLASKQLGAFHGIIPSFMAKPHPGLPGTSGHVHISLIDTKSGRNLFARESEDVDAKWPDIRHLSDLGRYL